MSTAPNVRDEDVPPHRRIHAEVLAGVWSPGERLQPTQLAKRYDTSTTVIREALTRLAGMGFVVMRPNRGFFVPELSLDDLVDITEVRIRNEEHAVELAIQRGDLAWESEVLALHHQFIRTPRPVDYSDVETRSAWTRAHRSFQRKVLERCGVPILMDNCDKAADAVALYRRWADSTGVRRDVEAETRELLEAVLDRDIPRAQRALRNDSEKTLAIILESGLLPAATDAAARSTSTAE